nr:hypothetical protein Q903MT_gene817 [Picea sitchensis]
MALEQGRMQADMEPEKLQSLFMLLLGQKLDLYLVMVHGQLGLLPPPSWVVPLPLLLLNQRQPPLPTLFLLLGYPAQNLDHPLQGYPLNQRVEQPLHLPPLLLLSTPMLVPLSLKPLFPPWFPPLLRPLH